MIKTSLIILLLLSTANLKAQWRQLDLPRASFMFGVDSHLYSILGNGFYFSTKNDSTYSTDSSFVNAGIVSYALSGQKIYLGTWQGILLSTNNGATWISVDTNLWNGRFSLYAGSGNDIYLTPDIHGLYLSTNNGSSWTATVDSGLTNTAIFAFASLNNNIFVGTNGGGIFRSSNKGNSWTTADSGIPDAGFICALGVKDTILFCATWSGDLAQAFVPVEIYRSTDHGSTWSSAGNGIKGDVSGSFLFAGNNIFLSTNTVANQSRLFFSTSEGTIWNEVDFNYGLITSFAICDSDLIVSTMDNGVWSRHLSEVLTTVHKNNIQSPVVFSLSQNYPNPFNPTTTISFTLAARSLTSLEIFDILGRDVSTIVSEELQAGSYTRQWNAANLPSGVYFYRLQAGTFSKTRKLLLLK
jgi:Secretion system C-terminal sorting domain